MNRYRSSTPVLAALLLTAPAFADEVRKPAGIVLPGTDTQLKLYGFVQVFAQYYFNQFLYDNGTLIGGSSNPLNANSTPDKQFTMTPRSSRFGFRSATPSAQLGEVITNVEMDFASGDPHPRGNLKLRQAWIGVRDWTVGYTWSNWIDLDAAPETVDLSGPIGQTGNDTGRYTQIRYAWRLTPRTGLAFSVEQNQMAYPGRWGAATNPNTQDPSGSYASTIQPDAKYPSLVGALTHTGTWGGHVGLRVLQQNYGAYQPGTDAVGGSRPNRWAGAVQVSGNVPFGKDNFVYSIYTGQGVGAYGFSPQAAKFNMTNGTVDFYTSTGWQAGYTHTWTDKLRSNLIVTGLQFKNAALVEPTDIKGSMNYFVNGILKLSKYFEVGLEYAYEDLKTFGPNAVVQRGGGLGDSNHSSKLQLALTAKF